MPQMPRRSATPPKGHDALCRGEERRGASSAAHLPHSRSPGRQRTQHINAFVAAHGTRAGGGQGPAHLPRHLALAEAEGCSLPVTAPGHDRGLGGHGGPARGAHRRLDQRSAAEPARRTGRPAHDDPGIGPITATALPPGSPPRRSARGATSQLGSASRPSEIHGRQAEAGRHLQDGASAPATAAHSWAPAPCASRKPARSA
jgi:hypothetical protein